MRVPGRVLRRNCNGIIVRESDYTSGGRQATGEWQVIGESRRWEAVE